MTAEKSIKILKAVKMLKDDAIGTLIDTTEAYKMAIEALSKQPGGEQANESVIVDFVAFQRKWLKAHKIMELNSADEVMTEIFLKETGKAFIDSLGQSGENDEADQFREATKKTEDVPDTNVEKMPYKKPEIIHCGDCRWYEKSHYCGANYPAPDDFCSWAERRNDG